MKNSLLFVLLISFSIQLSAQKKNKKVDFEVKGNCGMCKERIEETAIKLKGVKYASWDIPSKKLTLIINENKCTPLDVKRAIANVGHDTDKATAKAEVYDKLPPCCKYRDPNSLLMDHGGKH
ncbi:metal transporter [Flagellimonas sp. 389]|uniref:heavy-metal-associated domain-containing protein n=1 Tax=Flagellimonas sp. 389 TaxID=2835862 RepID=UPI001BD51F73|nr:metal transporter [Flagellimonas sp. 389]MBS9462213.1 metal transporter [Flagellimonas sp. 389]